MALFGKTRAPEFPPQSVWLNSDALTMKSLRGKVVLIDFWTYSCINCARTLPHVKRWHERYARHGLVIIGVHAPEFDFEKEEGNVRRAISDLGVTYPVVLDANFSIWNAYANHVWPHAFLINSHGVIVHDHAGEGGVAETEMAIQSALRSAGATDLPAIPPDGTEGEGVCYRTTPELYLGYVRGSIGNAHDTLPNAEEVFNDVPDHTDDISYLHGHWKVTSEYVEHTRALAVATEYVRLIYSAFDVHLVMGSADDQDAVIDVTLDGKPIPAAMAGADVVIDPDGKTHVHVRHHRMYTLIRADHYHRGTLKIGVKAAGLQMFAFTFGGCRS